MHRELNQIGAKSKQRDQNSISSSGGCTSAAKAGEDHRKKENEHQLTENKPMEEVLHKFLCRSHKAWRERGVSLLQDDAVKDPLEDEYEDKGCDECDEEFFPVHNFLC
jgi:hypothetical protein